MPVNDVVQERTLLIISRCSLLSAGGMPGAHHKIIYFDLLCQALNWKSGLSRMTIVLPHFPENVMTV